MECVMNKVIFCLAIALGWMAVAGTAGAATWGHLKGPFSSDVQLTERINFAAQEREERSWRTCCREHSYRYHPQQIVLNRRY
jgi:hypothetical protein